MHISSINVNNLSCITHQLNTIKCITKQYHEMTIKYLSFNCFVGKIHLDHCTLSSSSFMKSSFLIQMIRWIRGSSRIEFFIFLIAWGIFFEWWELDLQFLPSSSSPLWVEMKVITSFWHTFFSWMNPTILGGHSRWPSPLLYSSLLLLPLQVVLWFGRLLWLHGLYTLDLHILQLVSSGHVLISILSFK